MACSLHTPNAVVEAVRACAEAGYLDTASAWAYPGVVLVGADGVGDGYSCCEDGLLIVEWSELTHDSSSDTASQTCDESWKLKVQLTVKRCSQVFDQGAGGNSNGGSPSPAVRNNESLSISGEAFYIGQVLRCCAISADTLTPALGDGWKECCATVDKISVNKNGVCWTFTVDLTFEMTLCCPPIVG